jgi:plasmid stability protein
MQYTLRKVPANVDVALRRRAQQQGRSLNEVALEALAQGAGVSEEQSPQRDLQDIAGTWRKDRAFERVMAEQDSIDEEVWR